jgi:hypothetical protein
MKIITLSEIKAVLPSLDLVPPPPAAVALFVVENQSAVNNLF